jgi:PadR family transcriptional regulator PadR
MNFPLSAGLLEACVLAELNRQDVYGYQLTQQLRQVLDISESTLYPVLRRLQKEACLTTYDQPCQGRNRRYYQITDQGKARLAQAMEEWKEFKSGIDRVLEGME